MLLKKLTESTTLRTAALSACDPFSIHLMADIMMDIKRHREVSLDTTYAASLSKMPADVQQGWSNHRLFSEQLLC